MSIRKVEGEYVCECDECGEEIFGGVEEDFKAFVEDVKDAGWKISKDGETWIHTCPECR